MSSVHPGARTRRTPLSRSPESRSFASASDLRHAWSAFHMDKSRPGGRRRGSATSRTMRETQLTTEITSVRRHVVSECRNAIGDALAEFGSSISNCQPPRSGFGAQFKHRGASSRALRCSDPTPGRDPKCSSRSQPRSDQPERCGHLRQSACAALPPNADPRRSGSASASAHRCRRDTACCERGI